MTIEVRAIIKAEAWCWQDKRIMRMLRNRYPKKRIATAITVYQTMTELASNRSENYVRARYSTIARMTGKSKSTVRRYLMEFISLGIIARIQNRKNETQSFANTWVLVDAESLYE